MGGRRELERIRVDEIGGGYWIMYNSFI
jgi:hypothetical protein